MGLSDDLRQAHLDEYCIKCKAASGNPCLTPKGKKMAKPHADRIHNGNILFEERRASGYYSQVSEG